MAVGALIEVTGGNVAVTDRTDIGTGWAAQCQGLFSEAIEYRKLMVSLAAVAALAGSARPAAGPCWERAWGLPSRSKVAEGRDRGTASSLASPSSAPDAAHEGGSPGSPTPKGPKPGLSFGPPRYARGRLFRR